MCDRRSYVVDAVVCQVVGAVQHHHVGAVDQLGVLQLLRLTVWARSRRDEEQG